jgi:hypothetical protein
LWHCTATADMWLHSNAQPYCLKSLLQLMHVVGFELAAAERPARLLRCKERESSCCWEAAPAAVCTAGVQQPCLVAGQPVASST